MKILIVEDDFGITELVSESLSELGYETTTAFSGISAIESIKNDSPELILLDYSLPDMTAKELINTLLKNEIKVPMFIVSTGQGDERIAVEMMKLGAYDYLTKDAAFFVRLPEVVSRAIEDLNRKRRIAEVEKSLLESEEKHRLLFETMTQGVVFQDAEGKILFANSAAERILGLSIDQLQGKKSIDPRWKAIHEDGSDFPGETHPVMVALQTGKKVNNVVMGIYNPFTESYTYISINAVPIFRSGEEKPYQVYATFDDITERKHAEDALRLSEKRARLQRTAIAKLVFDKEMVEVDDNAAFNNITSLLAHTIEVQRVGIWVISDDNSQLECISLYEYDKGIHSSGMVLETNKISKYIEALLKESRISIEDTKTDPRTVELIDGYFEVHSISSMLDSGIMQNGLLTGVVCLEHVGAVRKWYSDEEAFVSTVASIVAQLFSSVKQKRIKNALRQSEKSYRGLFNSLQHAIYLQDKNGVFLDVNDGAVKMYGYSREEMIGKTPEFVAAPNKNNFTEVSTKIQKAFEGEPQEFEFWGKRKNGEIFPKRVNVYKGTYHDKDVIIAIAEEITQRKKSEEALKASEEKYRNLINTMPNGFYRSTPKGYFIDANYALINMLGYDNLEELKKVNIPLELYVQSEERDEILATNPEFVNAIESYRLKTKDGRIIWLEDNARYVRDENDNILYHEGICRDITLRKKNETEIKRYTSELETLNEELRFSKSIIEENLNARNLLVDELEKINAEKDKFFSIIAHDLKSPFHAFLGLTGMMAENISEFSIDELASLSKEMNSKANNLFKLLKNLLEWARMQRGSMVFNPTQINLSNLLTEVIHSLSANAVQKDIKIINKIENGLILTADENMLNSISQNLLNNAVKFTKRGGEIVVAASYNDPDKSITISVKDSGVGMTEQLLNKLFKIEEKVGHQGTEGEESTGLGLLLCKEFVQKHEGKIWAASEPENGSTFFVELPIQ
ncbi:MAG: PAS domain S-box protein [Ignavibacteria bacterium]|nr:PAS domain S-box protein [Ignavibacteria bacterium]